MRSVTGPASAVGAVTSRPAPSRTTYVASSARPRKASAVGWSPASGAADVTARVVRPSRLMIWSPESTTGSSGVVATPMVGTSSAESSEPPTPTVMSTGTPSEAWSCAMSIARSAGDAAVTGSVRGTATLPSTGGTESMLSEVPSGATVATDPASQSAGPRSVSRTASACQFRLGNQRASGTR
ncbi:Uncharacterised protein [Mycobacteroides abscessus]|nr:Uncharacterised protein [Mycobacteroides abscessus]